MLKLSHRSLLILSGLVWLAVGIFLLSFGLNLLFTSLSTPVQAGDHFSLIHFFGQKVSGPSNGFIVVVTIGLMVGFLKGRTVLKRTATKQVVNLRAHANPAKLTTVFNKRYLILIGLMMMLGMLLRYLPIHMDVRGAIDVTIGAALINGASHYFKSAFQPTTEHCNPT